MSSCSKCQELEREVERLKSIILKLTIGGESMLKCDVSECQKTLCHKQGGVGEKRYCREHVCELDRCYKMKKEPENDYCSTHSCSYCSLPCIENSWYCFNHKCYQEGCTESEEFEDGYCSTHTKSRVLKFRH